MRSVLKWNKEIIVRLTTNENKGYSMVSYTCINMLFIDAANRDLSVYIRVTVVKVSSFKLCG